MFPARNAPVRNSFAALLGLVLVAPVTAAVPAKKPTTASGEIVPNADGSVTRAQMIAEVRQVFNRADTNHDGYMSRAEFGARMAVVINRPPQGLAAKPTKEQAQKMLNAANAAFNAVDANHDGKLSFAEAAARPLAAFDAQDTNHDGILTLAEKQAAHAAAAQQQPQGPAGPPEVAPTQPGR